MGKLCWANALIACGFAVALALFELFMRIEQYNTLVYRLTQEKRQLDSKTIQLTSIII